MRYEALDAIGVDWLDDQIDGLTESLDRLTPSEYNERTRYLPASVTSKPGFIRFALNPFMREILDCFDVYSPVREVTVKKGVQTTYSTLLESGVLYYADYIGTLPIMYMTADKGLAAARIENNFLPMFNQSDRQHIIRSADTGNQRKTGKTKDHLQFAKGAYLVPFGAQNADKMRSYSIAIMLKDEVDAWPLRVGRDGDPDALSDARTDGYTEVCKIFRGSTPLLEGSSVVQRNYLRGDQRVYRVACKSCNAPQSLRWNVKPGVKRGRFVWELEGGVLLLESVRYLCAECGHAHYEYDKTRLFSPDHGAHWHPTAKPATPFIRSYHVPALLSPVGMRPWWKCVSDWREAYSDEEKRVLDSGKLQVFYNNVLAEPYRVEGTRVEFSALSAHRRPEYRRGEIPNRYAIEHSGGPVLLLTCFVDVHDSNLAVGVLGFCPRGVCYFIDYWRFERVAGEPPCSDIASPQWQRVRDLVQDKRWLSDDGYEYGIAQTLVDAGYASDTASAFCAEYAGGVYPSIGRSSPGKAQRVQEFAEFTTKSGVVGYRVLVDHYKDRIAAALRRTWQPQSGLQKEHHFNAPVDASDVELREFSGEFKRARTDDRGLVTYEWHRTAANELFDITVGGHASVDIIAAAVCIEHFGAEQVDWPEFWRYIEAENLFRKPPPEGASHAENV